MTDRTSVLGIRLETEIKDAISKYLTRECVESLHRQMKRGEITLSPKGVVIERVNNFSERVNNFEPDPDGEWVREMAHNLNVDTRTFKKKIEQSIYR